MCAPSSARPARPLRSPLDPGVDPVVGDIRRPDRLDQLFAGLGGSVDVIHAAGVIHPAQVDDFTEVNARGTANVLRRGDAAGVRRVVHVSSNSPFGTNAHRTDMFRNDEPYHPYYGYGGRRCGPSCACWTPSAPASTPSSSARRGSTDRSSPPARRRSSASSAPAGSR